ncbi:MAG: ATP-dependent protease LonB, partial [Methanobacteriota archaeon]
MCGVASLAGDVAEQPEAGFTSTKDIKIPERLIDQVIGQDHAVEVIKTAAKQKRNVLLIGDPGTGKSMLGNAMAHLLSKEALEDILVYPGDQDENQPVVKAVPAGEGINIVARARERANKAREMRALITIGMVGLILIIGLYYHIKGYGPTVLLMSIFVALVAWFMLSHMKQRSELQVPKLLVNNAHREVPPFQDATGAHAGALLGDVRHDPFQSGGLGTPAHERVEPGMIHKAHKGVLFIDEIATLSMKTQQELLTALQEKKYPITGQSELSSGAMVRTTPAPCDFVLVAAGNLETIKGMHPALRSRIRGYGYEVVMRNSMPDTPENRQKLFRFVAQEVAKDGKIPHFTRAAVEEIIQEAKRRADRKGHLTLQLRDLGGLVRAAGDIALKQGAAYTDVEHVRQAKRISKTLEQQIADRYIEHKKDYEVFRTEGAVVGQVNGLAVLAGSGVVLPIAAEAAPAQSKNEGRIIATGKLGKIAKEAVQNVSALIKKYTGMDISNYDIHIQFLQAYEGVEGDSASISVATAVISAIEGIPIDQSVAMTGSLSVRGNVLPVGGITPKVEAAVEAGIRKVLLPMAH